MAVERNRERERENGIITPAVSAVAATVYDTPIPDPPHPSLHRIHCTSSVDRAKSGMALSLSLRGHNFRAAAAEATIYEIAADNADNLTRRNGEEDEVGRVWFGRDSLRVEMGTQLIEWTEWKSVKVEK